MMKPINKGLLQQTKLLLKGLQHDASLIWKCLDQSPEQQSNVYYFCLKIFEALINSQKKVQYSQNYQAMLSTLLVLEFYKNMKQKSQALILQSKQLFSQSYMKLYGHAEWVIEIFLKNTQQHIFARQFISRLCHAPKQISWKIQPGKQFQQIIQSTQIYGRQLQTQRYKIQKIHKSLKYTSFPVEFFQSKILSYGYVCFIDYLRSANYVVIKEIYQQMLTLLKGFIHSARITQKTNQLFLSYLFLLKSLITFYGCEYDEILKQMMYLLAAVRNFPGVLGLMGQQLFEIIHGELKTKGSAFRARIKHDFPNIDVKTSDSIGKKIYILSNQTPIFNMCQSLTITNLRKLFIYHSLSCICPQQSTRYFKPIQITDSQSTYKMYFKLCRIIDMTMNIESYQQLQKLQLQSLTQLLKYNSTPKSKLSKDQLQQLQDIINHQHKYKFFPYPIPDITQLKQQNFENKKHSFSINQLSQQMKSITITYSNQLFYQNRLSFIIFGDDYEINRWLKIIIISMQDWTIQMIKRLDIYILPIKKYTSSIARYIAGKDLWYKRFVYNVFKEKTLYPDISIMDEKIKDCFPSYLLNKSLQMYIREADKILPIQIYKCILKLKQLEQQQVVYFMSHLLIGVSAEIQILKNSMYEQQSRKKSNQQSMDSMDIYLEKMKKPPIFTVDVQASYNQTLNGQTVKRTQKKLLIQDIQICNTPREYFMGNIPDPTSRFFQVSILTQKMGRIFRRQIQNKQIFKRNNQHQIREAFKDLFINMSADGISIQSSDGLRVVVDGAATNKVQRVLILPMETKEKYLVKLPVKTFLPFERDGVV